MASLPELQARFSAAVRCHDIGASVPPNGACTEAMHTPRCSQ